MRAWRPLRDRLACGLVAAALVLGLGVSARAEPVTIFAAASTTDAVRAVAERFEAETGTPVRPVFAASSTLAKQIAAGAPADIYLSANVAWMDWLRQRGHIAAATRRDLLTNRLVLVVPAGAGAPPDLAALPDWLDGRRLAMGDPAHVPAGRYAKAALDHLGLWAALRRRAAFASDVRGALALVAQDAAPAGMVYATDARISEDVTVAIEVPESHHPPIRYPVARTADSDHAKADRLLAFLESASARRIFAAHGFGATVARSGS